MRGLRHAWTMSVLAVVGMVATAGRAEVSTTGDTYDTGYFYIGYNPNSTGTLEIDAGSVFNRSVGYLGYESGSTGTAVITGAGSTWANTYDLSVGYAGSGTLRVEAGGQVSNGEDGYLGYKPGSTGTAIITGAGSKWTSSENLYIGRYGSGTLRVEGGGEVRDRSGTLGYWSGSTGAAIIAGAGSKWTNDWGLYVGQDGSGTLTVSDGGVVSTKWLYASLSDLYGDGTITVQGGGYLDADLSFDATHGLTQTLAFGTGGTLQFTVDGTSPLGVGYKKSGSLRIAEGRSVASTGGYLGFYAGSTGEAVVTGAGSKWTNSGSLFVGGKGGGKLTVSDGGVVTAKTLFASLGDLHGDGSIVAQGVVLDGDLVFDAAHGPTQTLAFGSGGTLQLTLDGTGDLGAGYRQSGSLRIADGRSATSTNGYLGYHSGSMGTAIITGAGSKWTNSINLYVGEYGSGTLRVEAGAQVSGSSSYLGNASGSSGKVTVSGAGSKWTNSGRLNVGQNGSGLVEQSGGTVHAGSIIIGPKGSYILSSGLLEGSTSLTIQTGGSLSWQAGQVSVPSVTLDGGRLDLSPGGDKLLKLSSLNLANAGTLDLADNAMIVQADATSRAAVLQAIAGQIGAARNAEKIWQGAGITSSVARGDGSGLYGLGVILNVDAQGKAIYSVFEGEAVDANSVLVKYTLNGDADLNGVVDGSDYFFIDKGFLSKASGYGNGDFDYNGVIDGSDYFLIDKAYLATHAGGGAAGVNAVPEPGALGVVMIAAAGLVRRRRG